MRGKSMMAYVIFTALRVMEIKCLQQSTRSIYLHCAPYASHDLKLFIDVV